MNATPPTAPETPSLPPPPPPRVPGPFGRAFRWLVQHHFFGSFFIVLFVTAVISSQVTSRNDFANSELARNVGGRIGRTGALLGGTGGSRAGGEGR